MKCRLLREMSCRKSEDCPSGKLPAGTEIEHKHAFWLVRQGVAEAADDECRIATNRTPGQLVRAQARYDVTAKGIAPEDIAAFEAGQMDGYNPDGSFKPGPNYVPESTIWTPDSEENDGDE